MHYPLAADSTSKIVSEVRSKRLLDITSQKVIRMIFWLMTCNERREWRNLLFIRDSKKEVPQSGSKKRKRKNSLDALSSQTTSRSLKWWLWNSISFQMIIIYSLQLVVIWVSTSNKLLLSMMNTEAKDTRSEQEYKTKARTACNTWTVDRHSYEHSKCKKQKKKLPWPSLSRESAENDKLMMFYSSKFPPCFCFEFSGVSYARTSTRPQLPIQTRARSRRAFRNPGFEWNIIFPSYIVLTGHFG